jgi:hypothetical protein
LSASDAEILVIAHDDSFHFSRKVMDEDYVFRMRCASAAVFSRCDSPRECTVPTAAIRLSVV